MTINNDFDRTRTTGMSNMPDDRSTAQRATDLKDTAVDKATDLKDKAVDAVADLKDRAADTATDLKDKAAVAGQQASEQIDSAMTATGERMSTLAQTVRQNAPAGQVGEVANNAARALERGGDYLQRADTEMVRGDLENIIRDHPIEALAIGLGIGFLLGKSMNSRRNY